MIEEVNLPCLVPKPPSMLNHGKTKRRACSPQTGAVVYEHYGRGVNPFEIETKQRDESEKETKLPQLRHLGRDLDDILRKVTNRICLKERKKREAEKVAEQRRENMQRALTGVVDQAMEADVVLEDGTKRALRHQKNLDKIIQSINAFDAKTVEVFREQKDKEIFLHKKSTFFKGFKKDADLESSVSMNFARRQSKAVSASQKGSAMQFINKARKKIETMKTLPISVEQYGHLRYIHENDKSMLVSELSKELSVGCVQFDLGGAKKWSLDRIGDWVLEALLKILVPSLEKGHAEMLESRYCDLLTRSKHALVYFRFPSEIANQMMRSFELKFGDVAAKVSWSTFKEVMVCEWVTVDDARSMFAQVSEGPSDDKFVSVHGWATLIST